MITSSRLSFGKEEPSARAGAVMTSVPHRCLDCVETRARLCRPMCGRAVPFREVLIRLGLRPNNRGTAPEQVRGVLSGGA